MSRDDEIIIDLLTAYNLILEFTKGIDKENLIGILLPGILLKLRVRRKSIITNFFK